MPEEMEKSMKVRVKNKQKGFIYGSLRKEGAVFTLKEFEHPSKADKKGNPLVVTAEDQFSKVWMEKVDSEKEAVSDEDKSKKPAAMKVGELKETLTEAGIEIPDGAVKADLVVLLEDHLSSEE